MDVIAVREAVAEGIRLAREEQRPTLLEAFTYRYRGHSAADPEVYREREEVEEWREKDPIESFARRCVEAGVLGEREVQAGRARRPRSRSLAAVEFAEASPEPALDTMYENLYALDEPGGWYAVDERSPEPHRGEREEDDARRGARAGRGRRRLRGAADGRRGRTRRCTATPRTGSSREVADARSTTSRGRPERAGEEDEG